VQPQHVTIRFFWLIREKLAKCVLARSCCCDALQRVARCEPLILSCLQLQQLICNGLDVDARSRWQQRS
jgi:hypothetical protein